MRGGRGEERKVGVWVKSIYGGRGGEAKKFQNKVKNKKIFFTPK